MLFNFCISKENKKEVNFFALSGLTNILVNELREWYSNNEL